MTKLNKGIGTAKKLISLPYNKFNLENYLGVLSKYYSIIWTTTDQSAPIKLMSGDTKNNNPVLENNAGIVRSVFKSTQKRTIYIVGKGIMFDSGGLDIKRGMADMAGDKAGAVVALSVANYLKGNVVAFCPFTTNFVQTSKITPGDEIKVGKKIIKVTNTDAEGRLILAEALSMLDIKKNDIIITVATLTGAVEYAIGEATGVFSPNSDLLKKYADAAFEAEELCWGLPLWEKYQHKYYSKKLIENSIRQIKCGATEGAMFIKQFVPYPENWIHLDIASSASDEKGPTGDPIKSLINFIRRLQ